MSLWNDFVLFIDNVSMILRDFALLIYDVILYNVSTILYDFASPIDGVILHNWNQHNIIKIMIWLCFINRWRYCIDIVLIWFYTTHY